MTRRTFSLVLAASLVAFSASVGYPVGVFANTAPSISPSATPTPRATPKPKCVRDTKLRDELRVRAENLRATAVRYRDTLEARLTEMKNAFNDFEDRDGRIRAAWQTNADSDAIGAIIEDEAMQQINPILVKLDADGTAYEAEVRRILTASIGIDKGFCTRARVSQSLRVPVRSQRYQGTVVWRNGLNQELARYRVNVSLSYRSRSSSARMAVNANSLADDPGNLRVRYDFAMQPQVRVSASIVKGRAAQDKKSVRGRATLPEGEALVDFEIEDEVPVVVR